MSGIRKPANPSGTSDRPRGSLPSNPMAEDTRDPEGDPGAELMLRWRDGDDAAFDALVDRYSGQVYALLTRFLGRSHPGREDMVQEVFLRILRARDRYEPTARFSTWLYSITLRMCINETERGRSRRTASLDSAAREDGAVFDPADEGAPAPAELLERGDTVGAVRAAIASLPENQRVALVLARYHDMPYAQIAEVVGSTEKAIKSLIHRARETLRKTLAPLVQLELQAGEEPFG